MSFTLAGGTEGLTVPWESRDGESVAPVWWDPSPNVPQNIIDELLEHGGTIAQWMTVLYGDFIRAGLH